MRTEEGVTVYWRPGCPYCTRLLADLDHVGLPVHKVNIWADPAAAATVRGLAGGNETVPTVVVADTAMVNPRPADVLDAVRKHTPERAQGRVAALATGSWWAGLAVTLTLAAIWFVLAASNPTTTYHFAPALVTAAWPVGRRLRAGRGLPIHTALVTTAGSTLLALATTTLLATFGTLVGPTLVGTTGALTEMLISTAVGAVAGIGLAVIGWRASRPPAARTR